MVVRPPYLWGGGEHGHISAEAVAQNLGCSTRSVNASDAAEMWGEFTALIMSASSRSRAPRSRHELGWSPMHTDMLTTVGGHRSEAAAGA
jgi:hypothetical protein